MKTQYKCCKVCFLNLTAYYTIAKILIACGKDMSNKYGLHHWNNGYLKTCLIVCYLSLKNDIWVVKSDDGQVVATFQTNKTSKGLHFGKLATNPRLSGMGIGSLCMNYIENLAIQSGCNKVYMEVYDKSQHAIDFYLHRGYVQCGETESLKYKEYIFSKKIM